MRKTVCYLLLFCGIVVGNHLLAASTVEALEKQHLKLYVNFDDGVKPVIIRDGCGLKKAVNNSFVPGKYGNAVNFPEKTEKLSDLIYKTGKTLSNNDWTIALTFTCKNGSKRIFINGYEARYLKNKTFKTPGMAQKYLRLGNMYSKAKGQLRGALDELKVFDKALEEKEIKTVMDAQPGTGKSSLKPVFYLPLEGKPDAVSENNTSLSGNVSRVNFAKAVIGQGALLMRLGYDARSVMNFSNVPKIMGDAMTADFFFIPRQDADKETRGLLAARGKNCSWIFIRSGKQLIFRLTSDKHATSIKTAIDWKKGTPVHILGGYSLKSKQVFLAVNGKKILFAPIQHSVSTDNTATVILGDIPGTDRYQQSLAEGIIDEVRIFNSALNSTQTKAEFARKDHSPQILTEQLGSKPIEILKVNTKEKQLWDISGAWKTKTASRQKICLNALWRFQVCDSDKFPGNSKWRYLAIPGRYSGHGNGRSDHQFLIRDKNFKTLSQNLPAALHQDSSVDLRVTLRHGLGGNWMYFDGHVDWQPGTKVWTGTELGWFLQFDCY